MIRILVIMIAIAGCGGTKRSSQQYRADSERTLETRHAQIEACYQKALEIDAKAAGTLTVKFVVERKTGVFKSATIDPTKSNAPESLVTCVVDALAGLKLDPADRNEGHATFVYQLQPSA